MRSLEFYQDGLGLTIAGTSLNEGIEQARLSGVDGARVRITGLRAQRGPRVELLDYLEPGPGHPRRNDRTPRNLDHWETIVEAKNLDLHLAQLRARGVPVRSNRIARCELGRVGRRAVLVKDPDGHAVPSMKR